MPIRRIKLDKWTPLIIVGLFPFIGLIDILLYRLGGNNATISWRMLISNFKFPMVSLGLAYSCGVLMRHCFFPVMGEDVPSLFEVLARMSIVLSPLTYTLVIVLSGNGTADANKRVLWYGGQWGMMGYVCLAFVLGMIAGRFLPQHISPNEPSPEKQMGVTL